MKLPIIIDNFGDLLVFNSVEDAQNYIEPIDVQNKEYIAYDSEGRLLDILIITEKPNRFSSLVGKGEQIVLQPAESEPRHATELHNKLIHYFTQLGEAPEQLSRATLTDLAQKGVEKYRTE